MLKKFPAPIRFIFLTYFCGLLFFSFFRLILFLLNINSAADIPSSVIAYSFVTGWKFDTVINGYGLALSLVVYFLLSFSQKQNKLVNKIVFGFLIFFYSFCFFILSADIPWFEHQQTRLTVAAMQWTNTPGMMLRFVFEDPRNYPYLILLGILIYGFYRILRRIHKKSFEPNTISYNLYKSTIIYIFFMLLTFIAIRGRVALKSPIRWGTAFVSEYNFTNQLGLNPVYTFLQSWLDKMNATNRHLTLMEDAKAISIVQQYYGLKSASIGDSPIKRIITPTGNPKPFNVIVVLMESMTSYNLEYFGNKENLTPELNTLFNNSLSFTRFYSDGIHTFNGIYSSLFGTPSLPNKHHLKDLNNQQEYGGLARTLDKNKYQTIFFTSHDEQFDNAGGFLASNGFSKIVSQKDYENSQVLNALGIPDHILFSEAVKNLKVLYNNRQPFFAAILTASNHGPYEIPPGISFKPRSKDIRKQLVEYADWSVGQFIQSCRQQPWFDSTIFLFTGDHGAVVDDKDANLSYHHVPLIVFAPSVFNPATCDSLGGQVDIFPTVMGMLNLPYTNNSFGIDLLKERRAFITFSYDENYGAFSRYDYFINRKGNRRLYQINSEGKDSREINNQERMDSMQNFTHAVFQTHQWMLENRLVNK
jgi:phosphoglycerol transferase MdoB-like AlkP superfamily enzyme